MSVVFKQATGVGFITATSRSVTFPSSVTIGDLLLIFGWGGGTGTLSASDTIGNSYTQIGVKVGSLNMTMWYTFSKSSGANTATFSSTTSAVIAISVAEYSGVQSLNTSVQNSVASTTTPTSGSLTPSSAGELGVCVIGLPTAASVSIIGVPINWNIRVNFPGSPNQAMGVTDNLSLPSGAQTTSQTWNVAPGGGIGINFAAFTPAVPTTTNWLSGQREFINKHNR